MAERQITTNSNINETFDTNDSSGVVNRESTSVAIKNTTYAVRSDLISQAEFANIKGEKGRVIMIAETEEMFYYDNDEWLPFVVQDNSNITIVDSIKNLGWESYADTVYTEASPLVVAENTTIVLDNNANIVISDHAPLNSSGMYNSSTNKITPLKEGDYIIHSIRFDAKTTVKESYMEYALDIGQAILPNFPDGLIFPDTVSFPKGANVKHPFNIVSTGYAGAEYTANGGIPKVTAKGGDVEIYNIEYQISIVSKGK